MAITFIGWTSPHIFEADAFSGPIFEIWVAEEILESWQHNGLHPSFYFYRDKDHKEIDVLVIKDGIVYPIEIKKSALPGISNLRYTVLANTGMTIGGGCIVCLVNKPVPISNAVYAIPVNYL
ncbi:MAG: DUF4143 domain-containing protein [Spirochaetota bacterium]